VDASQARILDFVQDLEEQVTIDFEISQQVKNLYFSTYRTVPM
jgi:hypothetical protein